VSRRVTCIALCSTLLLVSVLASPAAAAVPKESRWVADVHRAMSGSRAYVDKRVSRGGTKLAVNFDIDNTTLASHYDYGNPVAVVLRFARHARGQGVILLFNTGRIQSHLGKARRQLRKAGYVVTEICGRKSGHERLAASKERCRRRFVRDGYTIIANVGNRKTDFLGGNYERAFRLPNYHNQLG
jgi:HAD superfamily, subfamily IIIB (Acid phosphatase)